MADNRSPHGTSIDLNCDMGESFGRYRLGNDREMLNIVTSANIACGMHAGDPTVIERTISWAVSRGVVLGAHPSYPDLQGFGRRAMDIAPNDLKAYIIYQIAAVQGFAKVHGKQLRYIKPHGALYNTAITHEKTAQAIVDAVSGLNCDLAVMTLPHGYLADIARCADIRVLREGFVDRAYTRQGTLVSRDQEGAVIHDPEISLERALRMASEATVTSIDGFIVPIHIDTLCIHGDTPRAPEIARMIRTKLEANGITIQPVIR